MDQSKLDRIREITDGEGVIFEFMVPVSVSINDGVVQWSSCDAFGALVSINDGGTSNEYSGEEYDEILDAFGDIADNELKCCLLFED